MSAGDNLWGEEESFQDMPESAQTVYDERGRATVPAANSYTPRVAVQPSPSHSPQRQQAVERSNRVVQELNNEEETEGYEDEEDVLSDADLRLEQGKLYKLIMKHDLFADVEADERAIQNVQKAIRKFAKEQMEIMLGMRSEQAPESVQVVSPFNALEIEVLKTIASTFSKGATDEYEEESAPLPAAPKRKTLNPIGGPKKQSAKPLASKPQAPVKRARPQSSFDATIDQIAREEGVPRELLEEGQLLNKPVHELTADELLRRNQLVSQRRGTQVKSAQAAPMPSPEQMANMVASSVTMSPNATNPVWSNLINKVKSMPQSINHQDWSDK